MIQEGLLIKSNNQLLEGEISQDVKENDEAV